MMISQRHTGRNAPITCHIPQTNTPLPTAIKMIHLFCGIPERSSDTSALKRIGHRAREFSRTCSTAETVARHTRTLECEARGLAYGKCVILFHGDRTDGYIGRSEEAKIRPSTLHGLRSIVEERSRGPA